MLDAMKRHDVRRLVVVNSGADGRFVRRVGHVITARDNPGLLSMMLREAFRK